MESAVDQEDEEQIPPADLNATPPQLEGGDSKRPGRAPRTYAESVTGRGETPSDGEDDGSEDDEPGGLPGPIKGFDAVKIYENLNGQVQHNWESRASFSVLVHYLDGGYGPGLAENVKLIKKDLSSKLPTCMAGEPLLTDICRDL